MTMLDESWQYEFHSSLCHQDEEDDELGQYLSRFLHQFVDFDDTFLRICILFVVGPDTVVGSASGNSSDCLYK